MKKKIDEDYMDSEISKINKGDLDVLMNNNEKISDKISGANALKKYTELGKVMFGMVNDYRKGRYREVPWYTIATITFSLLYVLNPLDIIPDFIPGFGYLDDLTVFAFGLKLIQTDLHTYLDWKVDQPKGNKQKESSEDNEASTNKTSTKNRDQKSGDTSNENAGEDNTSKTGTSRESGKIKKEEKVKKPGSKI